MRLVNVMAPLSAQATPLSAQLEYRAPAGQDLLQPKNFFWGFFYKSARLLAREAEQADGQIQLLSSRRA